MSDSEVRLDFERQGRTGLSEAVLCAGKSSTQLATICENMLARGQGMLFTRLSAAQFDHLEQLHPGLLDYDPVSRTAWFRPAQPRPGSPRVAVVTAGSSDVPVAREAIRTLHFYGWPTAVINDVGVAGLWRLTERLEELKAMDVIVCVAGLDAALPTVLGGLVPGLIIAVPTSIGYGMARQGETALAALLVSCAPGLVVVNIDNGFGAACAALRALRIGSN